MQETTVTDVSREANVNEEYGLRVLCHSVEVMRLRVCLELFAKDMQTFIVQTDIVLQLSLHVQISDAH